MKQKNKDKKIRIYKNGKELAGFVIRIDYTTKIAVVSVKGKVIVGRFVNNWIEV